MQNYYRTNAVYEYILSHRLRGYVFAKENTWILLYGDDKSRPKLLLVAFAASKEAYREGLLNDEEKRILKTARFLSARSRLPLHAIKFCQDSASLDEVRCYDAETESGEIISMESFEQMLASDGLTIQKGSTGKQINKQSSSLFHQWQRENLGNGITVADPDLIRFEDAGKTTIYELKRSFIPLNSWQPYARDIANYKLLASFAEMCRADFRIVYNVRRTKPFYDDISFLKLFEYSLAANRFRAAGVFKPEELFG